MTIDEARRELLGGIKDIYEKNEAENISEIALESITGLSRIEKVLNKNNSLTDPQKIRLSEITNRLQQHEPIQYIINEAWFAGLKLYVDKNVLIPRPETEQLVEWVISDSNPDNYRKRMSDLNPKSKIPNLKYLDVGTGSGCIAIALKHKIPNAEVWACDVSDQAINVARMNADASNAAIDFVPLDFLDRDQRQQLPRVDIIVSNPPYVPRQEKNEMRRNVVDFEPATALFVDEVDPLIFYNAIADFGKEKLNEKGRIYVEIHEKLGTEIKDLFQSKGYDSVELKKDLQGKERMIKVYGL